MFYCLFANKIDWEFVKWAKTEDFESNTVLELLNLREYVFY